jgi:sarcosine oxidase, subunit gamma
MVNVQKLELRGMITLRCDLSKTTDIIGLGKPAVGRIVMQGARALAWMSPDEVLLLMPPEEVAAAFEQISEQFQEVHHLAVDVSDARALFALTGIGAREVIAKLAPVDMHADGFGPGQFRRSRLGQVAAAFWMTESNDIHLICFRSVADYVAALLEQSAKDGPVGHLG